MEGNIKGDSSWKKSWKSSEKPKKQRKYRSNAPKHQRSKFLSARLEESVRDRVGTKTLPIREGDRAEIMRGDHKGDEGLVDRVDYREYKVYLEGVERERVDTTNAKIAVDPSNLKITKLKLEDNRRLEKYEISEDEKEEIKAEEREETEGSEESEESGSEEVKEVEEAEESGGGEEVSDEDDRSSEEDVDYQQLAGRKISDIKEKVQEENADPEKMLEAEKSNKDRKTLKEWLEKRIESEGGG
ncbi:MAG: 50S ribosomal protein L24 [Candidatus Nanohaloarchaea archaeon]|nr:50S ribosomal protein L24 [Candidatus Nanohaloarchaea archaeon]